MLDMLLFFLCFLHEQFQGRILVYLYLVEERKLKLICEKKTNGAVYALNAFNGKLLAAINEKLKLYNWIIQDDGTYELQFECGHYGRILALFVQTRGDYIVVGDLMKSISLLIYKVSNKLPLNIPLPCNLLSRHLNQCLFSTTPTANELQQS